MASAFAIALFRRSIRCWILRRRVMWYAGEIAPCLAGRHRWVWSLSTSKVRVCMYHSLDVGANLVTVGFTPERVGPRLPTHPHHADALLRVTRFRHSTSLRRYAITFLPQKHSANVCCIAFASSLDVAANSRHVTNLLPALPTTTSPSALTRWL